MNGSRPGECEPADFQLLETMRFTPEEGIYLLEEHLERLAASSRYFGFKCPLEEIRQALASLAQQNQDAKMLRLILQNSGRFEIELKALPPKALHPRVVLSEQKVNSANTWLNHKTTCRQLYDAEHARLSQITGCFEVLFCNERNELTEGSRTNLFIEREGALLTPPLACGLLPGTLRQHLLQTNQAQEAILSLSDLQTAPHIFVGNSVRGLVEVEF